MALRPMEPNNRYNNRDMNMGKMSLDLGRNLEGISRNLEAKQKTDTSIENESKPKQILRVYEKDDKLYID